MKLELLKLLEGVPLVEYKVTTIDEEVDREHINDCRQVIGFRDRQWIKEVVAEHIFIQLILRRVFSHSFLSIA